MSQYSLVSQPELREDYNFYLEQIEHLLAKLYQVQDRFLPSHDLAWIHHGSSYNLDNVCLSMPCLTLVLDGVKHIQFLGQEFIEDFVPKSGFCFVPANRLVSVRNIALPRRYLAFSLGFSSSTMNNVIAKAEFNTEADKNPIAIYKSIIAYLEALFVVQDPSLAMILEEQILYLAYKAGLGVFNQLDNFISEIRQSIEKEPFKDWTSDLVAKEHNISQQFLQQKLQSAGFTCKELIKMSKMHTALFLLHRGVMSLGQIADYCGYASKSIFSQSFKDFFHISPAEIQPKALRTNT